MGVRSLGREDPTTVFLLGKSHGQRSLAGYSAWGHRVRHNLAADVLSTFITKTSFYTNLS